MVRRRKPFQPRAISANQHRPATYVPPRPQFYSLTMPILEQGVPSQFVPPAMAYQGHSYPPSALYPPFMPGPPFMSFTDLGGPAMTVLQPFLPTPFTHSASLLHAYPPQGYFTAPLHSLDIDPSQVYSSFTASEIHSAPPAVSRRDSGSLPSPTWLSHPLQENSARAGEIPPPPREVRSENSTMPASISMPTHLPQDKSAPAAEIPPFSPAVRIENSIIPSISMLTPLPQDISAPAAEIPPPAPAVSLENSASCPVLNSVHEDDSASAAENLPPPPAVHSTTNDSVSPTLQSDHNRNADAAFQPNLNQPGASSKPVPDRHRRKRHRLQTTVPGMSIVTSTDLAAPELGLKAGPSSLAGRGVFAAEPFRTDSFVVEYKGKLLSHKEGVAVEKELAQDQQQRDCYLFFFMHKNRKFCIDATVDLGFLGRLLNHSLQGNLRPECIEVDKVPHICFFASRFIEVGEELTYNYGESRSAVVKINPWLAEKKSPQRFPDCAVCQDLLAMESMTLPCTHTFCKVCIVEWLKCSDTCPVCRSDPGDVICLS